MGASYSTSRTKYGQLFIRTLYLASGMPQGMDRYEVKNLNLLKPLTVYTSTYSSHHPREHRWFHGTWTTTTCPSLPCNPSRPDPCNPSRPARCILLTSQHTRHICACHVDKAESSLCGRLSIHRLFQFRPRSHAPACIYMCCSVLQQSNHVHHALRGSQTHDVNGACASRLRCAQVTTPSLHRHIFPPS